MKKIFLYIPAMILLAVSCEKETINPSDNGNESASGVKMITEIVSGSRGDDTKATIGNATPTFAWTVGDNVAVHVSNGATNKYVVTTSGASAAAASAKFTVEYEEGYSRDAFAVYPSNIVSTTAANYGQSGHALDVTLPGSYTLAQVSGETSPCPMISANEAGSGWHFYQLCGLLRLTVKDIPATAKRLEIDFDGKQVWGDFSVASPVVASTAVITTAADGAHDIITITKDGTDAVLGETSVVVNIPLPTGTYSKITVKTYDALTGGNATLSPSQTFAYSASKKNGVKRTATFPSSKTAFRGYEVSTGILERNGSADPATYSLTAGEMILSEDPVSGAVYYSLPAGCNPFEPAVKYGQSSSLNKYFNKWGTLKTELGGDGSNIKATSDKLPAGWQFPSGGSDASNWGRIILGAPKSTITVNNATVANSAFALVSVTLGSTNAYSVAENTYKGMVVLRDGSTIPAGYLTTVGLESKYADNPLTEVQFNDLLKLGCLFIPVSGYYSDTFGWRDLSSSYQEGYYWSATLESANSYYNFHFTDGDIAVTTRSTDSDKQYKVVKLVKPVTD